MGEAMADICLIYGFNMVFCPTYQTHTEPLIFYFVLLLSVAMGWLRISQSSIQFPQ